MVIGNTYANFQDGKLLVLQIRLISSGANFTFFNIIANGFEITVSTIGNEKEFSIYLYYQQLMKKYCNLSVDMIYTPKRKRGWESCSLPSWAEAHFIRANFLWRVSMESSNRSIQLELNNCLTLQKMAIAVQKQLSTSTSPYANFWLLS